MEQPRRVEYKFSGKVFTILGDGESAAEAELRLAQGMLAGEQAINNTSVRAHITIKTPPPVNGEDAAFKTETRPVQVGENMMTLQEFLRQVVSGRLDDSDGYGFYATEEAVSQHRIRPSYVRARHEPQCGVFYGETRFTKPCDCGLGDGVELDQERIDRRWTHVRWHQYKEIKWPEGRD